MRVGYRARMMLAIFLVSMICAISAIFANYLYTASSMKKNYVNSLDEKMTLQMNYFDDTMEEMYRNLKHISCDQELIQCVQDYLKSDKSYKAEAEVVQKMKSVLTFDKMDSALCLFLPDEHKSFSTRQNNLNTVFDEKDVKPWEKRALNPFVPVFFTEKSAESQRVFVYSEPFYGKEGGLLGYLYITLEERQLYYQLIDSLNKTRSEEYMLITDKGMICSARNTNKIGEIGQGFFKKKQFRMMSKEMEKDTLFTYVEGPFSTYTLMCKTDLKTLTEDISKQLKTSVSLCIVVLLFLGVISFVLSSQMAKPMEELAGTMKKVAAGDFDVKVRTKGDEEFRIVADQFNELVKDLNNLMDQVVEERTQKKQAEINALQAQIRPHFMYNTLNSIRMAATMQKNTKLAGLLGDYIELLEASIQKKGAFITLNEEIHLVKDFASLQAFRYMDIFEMMYNIEEDAGECYVPCLMLQPIVENAIFHAVDTERTDNLLEILAWTEEEKLHVLVKDNGEGFREELTNEEKMVDTKRLTGIGVKNTKERLQLYYGERSTFSIRSVQGKGTTVEITLPISHDPGEYAI